MSDDGSPTRRAARWWPPLRLRGALDREQLVERGARAARMIWPAGLFVLLAALHMLWWGYGFGHTNHCVQIPILKRYFHPELFPDDIVAGVAPRYVTFYYMLLAAVNQLVGNLQLVFFIAHLAVSALTFAATYQLARTLTLRRASAVIAVALSSTKLYDLQLGGVLHRTVHSHTFAALPLALWAMTRFLRGKRLSAYAAVGIAFNINAQVASYTLAMLGLATLAELRRDRWRAWLKASATELGLFLLCAAPTLIWILQTSGGALTPKILDLLEQRSKEHIFPKTWDDAKLTTYAMFAALGVVLWQRARCADEGSTERAHRSVGWFGLATLLLCAAGTVFTEYYPLKLVLRAHLFRATTIISILIMIYAAEAVRSMWRRGGGYAVLGGLLFATLLVPSYRQLLPALLIALVLIEQRKLPIWTVIAPLAAFGLALHWELTLPLPRGIRLDALFGPFRPLMDRRPALVLWLAVMAWVALVRLRPERTRPIAAAVLALLVVTFVLPRAAQPMLHHKRPLHPWVDLQLWAHRATPPHAVFITPPYYEGFRVFSERSTVVEHKDGTLQMFSDSFSKEWARRMRRIGGNRTAYEHHDERSVLRLARDFGVSYIVFERGKQLPFPVAYRNSQFVVYRIVEQTPSSQPSRGETGTKTGAKEGTQGKTDRDSATDEATTEQADPE